jgi:hypothetical protein
LFFDNRHLENAASFLKKSDFFLGKERGASQAALSGILQAY